MKRRKPMTPRKLMELDAVLIYDLKCFIENHNKHKETTFTVGNATADPWKYKDIKEIVACVGNHIFEGQTVRYTSHYLFQLKDGRYIYLYARVAYDADPQGQRIYETQFVAALAIKDFLDLDLSEGARKFILQHIPSSEGTKISHAQAP